MALAGMLKGAQVTAWQTNSWPLQVPFSRHFLDEEPTALYPGWQTKRQVVL